MEFTFRNSGKPLKEKDFEELERQLGHAIPQRMKDFYMLHNGGSMDNLCLDNFSKIMIDGFIPFRYIEGLPVDSGRCANGATIHYRNINEISGSILIFAAADECQYNRIVVDVSGGQVYIYYITRMNGLDFVFGEKKLIANSLDEFFDNLVVKETESCPTLSDEIEEQEEGKGTIPVLSYGSVALTKEDVAAFEKELDVQLPGSMKNFYLKYNGGMPEPYLFLPQNEEMDFVEIKAFFPIKQCTDAFETIEVIAREAWNDNFLPRNLLPFAMDSGGNYYALNLKNKKIYYFVTDVWDDNLSREDNFKENMRYIAQSFKFFISHFEEEEE